jgi:hypothetical protein
MSKFYILVAFVFAAIPAIANASFGVFDMGTLTNTLSTDGVTQSERERAKARITTERRSVGQAIETTIRQGSQSATSMPINLTYKISMQRRQANYDSFIKKSMAANKVAGAEIQAALGGRDVIAMAQPVLRDRLGLRIDNVGDAYAMWLLLAWQAANLDDRNLTRAQVSSAKILVSNSMSNVAAMQSATDEVKQNMAESLWTYGIILNEAMAEIKNDPAKRSQLASSVLANTKREMGVDLSAFTLTDQGFVLRKSGKPR